MPAGKFVHRDSVAGTLRLLARGIGNRAHRRIKMLAVARKRQPNKITLPRGVVVAQPVVRKIAQLIIAQIKIDCRAPDSCVP